MVGRWGCRRLAAGIFAVMASPVLMALLPAPTALAADPPVPAVGIATSPNAMVGSDVPINLTFTNSSPDGTGYGPYIDLVLPLGADGDDGLTFVSATYLDAPVVNVQLTADVTGCVWHPWALDSSGLPLHICGLTEGQAFVALRMPFGSFTPGQPTAMVIVTTHLSDLADAGTPLTVSATGGFQFGADPLDNPTTDPSITGATDSADVSPSIMTIDKTYNGPENETATGPNFPRSYTLHVSVAPGQTVTDLTVTDTLPDNIQWLSTDATSPASVDGSTLSTSTPGGTVSKTFASVTGTGGVDASITVHFYVPRLDVSASAVLNPNTGAFAASTDSAGATATWAPIDVRDLPGPVSAGPANHTLTDKSVAIQKSASLVTDLDAAGASPGDTVQWTMSVQVSDYFALDNLIVDDLLGDGTRFDSGFTPTVAVNGNGFVSASAPFDAANYTVDTVTGSGTTPMSFRVSAELLTRLQPTGRLVGGCIDPDSGSNPPDCAAYDNGPTTVTITFRSIIQQFYIGGDRVVEGDTLGNQTSAYGDVLDTSTFAPTGSNVGDGSAAVATAGSGASIEIERGGLVKSIYAIDGNTSYATPVHIAPGDEVTYRLQQSFPTSRTDDFRIYDYLPLPIFDATQVTTFDATAGAAAPPTGTAKYGPNDTFHGLDGAPTPTILIDGTANSVEFRYGDYALYPTEASVADILFTVTVSTDPFADGLLLTNQARSQTRNSAGALSTADAIIQITLDQPVVTITKGVIGTDNAAATFAPPTTGPVTFDAVTAPPSVSCPGWSGGPITSASLSANPIDSNVTGVDGGDYVRFAMVVENTGHSAAFEVKLSDDLPAGFAIPSGGPDICAYNGAGTQITYTDIDGGSPGLFAAGIKLDDGAGGAIAAGTSGGVANATGSNVVIVTYTLQVADSAVPSATISNTASLIDFTNETGADGHLASPLTDTSFVTLSDPSSSKEIDSTSQPSTTLPAVAVGEIVTYKLTLTIPEGTLPAATVTDTLPAGMSLVDCVSVETASENVTTSLGADFSSACAAGTYPAGNPTVNGQVVTFDLGTVVNANHSNGEPEMLVLTYRAVVTNMAVNGRSHSMHNSAILSWTDGLVDRSIDAVVSPDVTVVEPIMSVSKTADHATGDAGDTITYTITVSNPSATYGADAFDVGLSDLIPGYLTYVADSFGQDSGPAADSTSDAGAPTLTASWDTFPQGSSAQFHYAVTVDADVAPSQTMTNGVELTWTSLPGDVTTPQSAFSAVSTERTGDSGDPGGSQNDYADSDTWTVTVPDATVAKTMTATNQAFTTGTSVAVGEIVTYQVVLTLPEGVAPALKVTDTLPAGMALVDCASVTPSSGDLSTNLAGATFDTACDIGGEPPNPSVSGQNVIFDLGDVTNANRVDGTPETITIVYQAVVLNAGTNVRGHLMHNTAQASWTDGGPTKYSNASSTANIKVVEPLLTISKGRNPATGDAGDTITYTIDIANPTNANGTDGFDAVWTDTIPAGLTYVPGSLQEVGGSCPTGTTTLVDNGAPTLTATWATFGQAGSCRLTYQATLDADVPSGSSYTNNTAVTWTSLLGDVVSLPLSTFSAFSTERTGDTGDPGTPSGAVNNYLATGSATVNVTQPAPVKTIAASSEAGTADPYATIGEIVRYRIVVTIPEGVTPVVTIVDALPTGLRYINDGTTRVAFVCDEGCMTSDAFDDPSLQMAGVASPTFDLPGSQISGGPFVDGTDPTFALGTLTNLDSDANAELVVIEFNALVDNLDTNLRGTSRSNTAAIYEDGALLATSAALDVTIAEPSITFAKTLTTTPVDAGDTIVYLISISNLNAANVSPAYEFHVTDTIDSNIDVSGIDVAGATLSWTDNSDTGTNSVDVTFDSIASNKSATIIVTGTIKAATSAGLLIPNTAGATWTSLPGDHGTTGNSTGTDTPGAPGSATGERIDDGGSLNSYRAGDGADTSIGAPTIAKLGPTPGTATIGATSTFDLLVTLPEGTTRGLVVTDNLPAGLIADSYSVVTTAAASDEQLTADYNGSLAVPTSSPPSGSIGGDWDFTFGDTVTAADNDATNNSFLIRVTVRVDNVAGNQSNGSLTNRGYVKYTDPESGQLTIGPSSRSLSIVEPVLAVAKNASTTSPRFGGTVTYTLTLSHAVASNADAYDVILSDTLPAGMTYVGSSLLNTAGLPPTTSGESGGVITITYASFPSGSTATFTYQATVGDSSTVSLKQTLVNNARATWTSMSGTPAIERTGADGAGGALNDYAVATTVTVTVSGIDMAITKSDGQALATAGATRTYTLGYTNNGNQSATGVVITEHVPVGATFNSAASTAGWSCPNGSAAGTACTHAAGTGTVAGGGSGSVNFAITVVDPIASGLTQISNTATIADDGTKNVDPTPANNTATDVDTINQADLSLTKGVDISRPGDGQVVTFTITVHNSGPASATNVRVTDLIPGTLTYSSATASQGTYASGTGLWTIGTMNNGATVSLQIRAQATSTTSATNVAEVTHSDQGDPDSTPANNAPAEDDYGTAAINPTVADLAVVKDVDNVHPNVGDNVTFTIVATNNGPDDATGVHVTDVLPAGTSFVSATPTFGAWAGSTWTIGELDSGDHETLTLVAHVDSAGATVNTATVAGDPFDPTSGNNTDTASFDQLVNLVVTKTVANPTPNIGTLVTFTVTVENEGPGSAHNVVIHDPAPSGLTFVGTTPDQGSYSDVTGNWTVGTIAAGDSASIDISALVVDPNTMTNVATLSHVDEPQSSTDDDSASASVTPPHADLAVTKTVAESRPDVGDDDSFTITVTNNGPDDASGVELTDLLPAGLGYAGDTPSQGSYDDSTGVWTVGDLDYGDSATLTIDITVDATNDYTNTASVTASDQYDPDSSNDSDSAALSTRVADIAVTKTPDTTTPAVGTNVTFTITATNNGPDQAGGLVVHDALPASLTWVSDLTATGTYDAASGNWTVGGLANGDSASLTITARVVGSGTIHNTAAVGHLLQRDPVPANDSDTATLDVPPAADLSLTKTVDDDQPDKDADVVFTITVTNHGPNDAAGIVAHDILPAGVTYIEHTAGQGDWDPGTGDWSIGALSVGEHATLDITVSADVEGPVVNTAEITASSLPDPDSTPGNGVVGEDDRGTATLNARGLADLSLTKSVSTNKATIGTEFTYTLTVTNHGPDAASGVVVRDQLPSGVVFVGSTGDYDNTSGAWTVGGLAVGDSASLIITVRAGQSGAISNTAEVVAENQRDPNSVPDNGVASEDDQGSATIQGARATAPPTALTEQAPAAPGGSLAILFGILALAVAGFFLVAASRRYSPVPATRRRRGRSPRR